jgi:hypothetical protein
VTFESLFRDYPKNREAILTLLFADAIKGASAECREVRATHAGAVEATGTGGRRKPGLPLLSATFTFHLGDVSLVAAESDLVHVIKGCGAVATVPYERLHRFAAPILSRVLATRPHEALPSEPRTADLREDLRKIVSDASVDFRQGKGGRTFSSADGHNSYASTMALRGCTEPAIWTRPGGEIEFTCQLFPSTRNRDTLYERLNRRVEAIVSVLPAGWEVERYPAAQPYSPVVVARDPTGRVELTAHVTPYVDGTFSAGLSVTRKVAPAPNVDPPGSSWSMAAEPSNRRPPQRPQRRAGAGARTHPRAAARPRTAVSALAAPLGRIR